jgi:hypothetical protein
LVERGRLIEGNYQAAEISLKVLPYLSCSFFSQHAPGNEREYPVKVENLIRKFAVTLKECTRNCVKGNWSKVIAPRE